MSGSLQTFLGRRLPDPPTGGFSLSYHRLGAMTLLLIGSDVRAYSPSRIRLMSGIGGEPWAMTDSKCSL
jgi:hypothetical protein